jgi:hypothetical protein
LRKILLHIGRHKTGTTAIQQFLGDNRGALLRAGYFVPLAGRVNAGHHGFAQPFVKGRLQETLRNGQLGELPAFRQLREELTDVPESHTVVISSEALQNCRPEAVRRAFEGYDARVVVYLRNQLEYLATAYVQRIHATTYAGSIDDYYRDVYQGSSNYFAFLKNWTQAFPDAVTVRRYASGAAVEDFCEHVLDIDHDDYARRSGDSNPSLNARLAVFKRKFNERELSRTEPSTEPTANKMYFALPRLNGNFPAKKYAVPPHIAADLLKRCLSTDAKTARQYFAEEVLFDYDGYESTEEPVVSDADYEIIYGCLLDEVAKASAEKSAAKR